MIKHKVTDYVSEIDKLLNTLEEDNPVKTASQQKEIAKHKRLFKLRNGQKDTAKESTKG